MRHPRAVTTRDRATAVVLAVLIVLVLNGMAHNITW